MSNGIAARNRRRLRSSGHMRLPRLLSLVGVLVAPLLAVAEDLPLWELGMGAFPSTYPAYRGSQDQQAYLLPFPYIIYRGDILKIDREGIRARLFDSDRMQLNLSLNGAIPVSSDDSGARDGMPDLNPTLEIGPSLNIRLSDPSPQQRLSLRLPLRAVIATDFTEAEHAGWLFHPHINLDTRGVAGGWNVGVSLGPLLATHDYHAYYYAVSPTYATPTRPAYRATSGYSGTAAILSLSRRYNKVWAGAFVRYDNLAGAAFSDSPLMETDHSVMAGFAVAYVFAKSSEVVAR